MKKIKNKSIFFLLAALILVSFSGCSSKPVAPASRVSLEVWGLFDSQDAYGKIFEAYKALNPVVANITYRKLTPDTYRNDIVEALAMGQGPDIILIQNNWLPSFKNMLAPAPAEIINEQKMKNNFVDVVANDFIDQGSVYAVPLSVDTLALYYNKDLFNAAGIIFPPSNWNDFLADSKKLTKTDSQGQLIQSGAAMGTAININRPTDILVNLMMQNGTEMTDAKNGEVTFNSGSSSLTGGVGNPGKNALDFFVQFARRNSPYYCWNNNMHYSIDAFSEQKLAMMFNYYYQKEAVSAKSPKLNFEIVPMPQLPDTQPVTYASYWGFGVLKNKTSAKPGNVTNDIRIKEAWKLLSFLTIKPEVSADAAASSGSKKNMPPANFDAAKAYLEKTPMPAARRDLIELQKDDPKLGVFAMQNLIAKNWYQKDPQAIEGVLLEMINQINKGQFKTDEGLGFAVKKINQLIGQ
jgi:multiple sugar transport system substrate-binding protein